MAYQRPQSNAAQQRGARAAYQYKNMNRYVPTQVKRWQKSAGNSYSMASWRSVDTKRQAEQYWNSATMKNLGGDLSLRDRMVGNYYQNWAPQGWQDVKLWQPGVKPWMQRRAQGDATAQGVLGQDYFQWGYQQGGSGQEGGSSGGNYGGLL